MNLVRAVKSQMTGLGFSLRTKIWGRFRFRRYLPLPPKAGEGELKFYSLVLGRAHALVRADGVAAAGRGDLSRATVVIDVGTRNWSYAPVLAQVFPRARLIGIEVDWARRYLNLYRRGDLISAMAAHLQSKGRDASVWFGDFRDVELGAPSGSTVSGPDIFCFCFLFPFVSADPCLSWGLPSPYAEFEALLRHAQKLGGGRYIIVSCHQGEWEAELARKAYGAVGLQAPELKADVVAKKEIEGLWPNEYDVYVFVAEVSVPSASEGN